LRGIDPHQSSFTVAVVDPNGVEITHASFVDGGDGYLEANFTDQLTVDVLPEDVWETVYQVNLRSHSLATKYAAPRLKASSMGPAIVTRLGVGAGGVSDGPGVRGDEGCGDPTHQGHGGRPGPDCALQLLCPGATETAMMRRYLETADDPAHLVAMMSATHLVPRPGRPEEIANCLLLGLRRRVVHQRRRLRHRRRLAGLAGHQRLSAMPSTLQRCEADVVDVAVMIEHGGHPHPDPRVGTVGEPPDKPHTGRVVELDQHRRQRDIGLGGARQERSSDHGEREDGPLRPDRCPVQ
jgi:hypothetical protein